MATTSLTIRMDENLKKQAETIFDDMGLSMTTAFTLFTKAVIRKRKIPFEIEADADPFWSDENQAHIKKSLEQLDNGQFIVKTMEELEAMANE